MYIADIRVYPFCPSSKHFNLMKFWHIFRMSESVTHMQHFWNAIILFLVAIVKKSPYSFNLDIKIQSYCQQLTSTRCCLYISLYTCISKFILFSCGSLSKIFSAIRKLYLFHVINFVSIISLFIVKLNSHVLTSVR